MDEMRRAFQQLEVMGETMDRLVFTLKEAKGNTTEIRQLRADANHIAAGMATLRSRLHVELARIANTEAENSRVKAQTWLKPGEVHDAGPA